MLSKVRNLMHFVRLIFTKPYFGFIRGHSYLSYNQINILKKYVGMDDHETDEIINEYEGKFASIIGDGKCISYAAGRMAFYSLLNELSIGKGDEVIIQTSNCSVMVNAILRTGATPIFTDIDLKTFGSNVIAIEERITNKTKMIVAQHTFGIPCNILPIVEIARLKNIFLLEDCALTVGSKIANEAVGNFGDAALFSTDHSKPINTIIGGLIYTKDSFLLERLHQSRSKLPNLSVQHQMALFKQLIFEKYYFTPNRYGFSSFINYVKVLLRKIGIYNSLIPDLVGDSNIPTELTRQHYPYPARFPGFLALLGLYELNNWNYEIQVRSALFYKLVNLIEQHEMTEYLPLAYFDNSLDIIPLRFVYMHPNAFIIKSRMKKRFDINAFWFLKPIVACVDPTEFGYINGTCLNSEKLAQEIINIPCVIDVLNSSKLIKYFRISIQPNT